MKNLIKTIAQYLTSKWKAYKKQRQLNKDWMYMGGKSAFKTTQQILSDRIRGKGGMYNE